MLSIDLMTSPPSSNAPSPSLASLARIPSLSPSCIAPIPRRASNISFTLPIESPPRSPGCLPSNNPLDRSELPIPDLPTNLLPRGSHSEVVGINPSTPTFSDTDLFAARLARPSCPPPIIAPILNVTIHTGRPNTTRKPSFKLPLPLPTPPTRAPSVSTHSSRPSLSVSYGGANENDSRRSSYTRTPYPLDEAPDYMSAQGADIRRVHPCDKGTPGGGGIQWVDPWAEANESSPLRAGRGIMVVESGTSRQVSESVQGKKESEQTAVNPMGGARTKVGSVDVCNWSSVGMDQAWSADSQSAVEGDSLLVGA